MTSALTTASSQANKFLEHAQTTADIFNRESGEPVIEAWLSFEQAALVLTDVDVANLILCDARTPALTKSIRAGVVNAPYVFERDKALSFLAQDNLKVSDMGDLWCYEDLVQQEIDDMRAHGMRVDAQSTIAFAGSGPVPATAILLQAKTGGQVIGIEKSAEAVDLSRQQIYKLGLGDKITIVQGCATEFDYKGIDTVIAASLIDKKAMMAEQIQRTAPDARAAFRSTRGMLTTMLYETIAPDAIVNKGFRHTGSSQPRGDVPYETHFFEPNTVPRCAHIADCASKACLRIT